MSPSDQDAASSRPRHARHRRPRRYRGHHRAPALAPRTRYGVIVGSALVGAGVVAFAAGNSLPQPEVAPSTAAAEAQIPGGGGEDETEAPVQQTSEPEEVTSTSREEQRPAAPSPEKLASWVRPADGYISSTYGFRTYPAGFHGGLDVAGAYGSPIRAASDGVVTHAGPMGGYGNLVIIDHGEGVITYYGHNSSLTTNVGDTVHAGDVVAKMGSTGQSTGNHLHFEVRVNDERINPLPWLRDRGAEI